MQLPGFLNGLLNVVQRRQVEDAASLESLPSPIYKFINRLAINYAAGRIPARPHPFSLWSPTIAPSLPQTPQEVSDYVSWAGLADRSFTGRHLAPATPDQLVGLPQPKVTVDALLTRTGNIVPSLRSHQLFTFFAQWFTDSFLRTDPRDKRKTTSNHEIDLCQIYGLDARTTRALRLGSGGLMKSRKVGAEEYPPTLYADDANDPRGYAIKPEFRDISYLRDDPAHPGANAAAWEAAIDSRIVTGVIRDPVRRANIHAVGLDRGDSTIGYAALNTIFLREHNRIARLIGAAKPDWKDNRIFETARMVNIRQLLTVTVEDYINHLAGSDVPFTLDRAFAEREPWYRTNRITAEFNLLYRWHSLVPDTIEIPGQQALGEQCFRFNNTKLVELGVEAVITAASQQKAGRIGLHNTPRFMMPAEEAGLRWSREIRLKPFNDYRARFGFPRYSSFLDLTGNVREAQQLEAQYGAHNINKVDFVIGLLAERRGRGDLMGETMGIMVAHDAFTHIFTNPLLATEVHTRDILSDVGLKIIADTHSLADIVKRNVINPAGVLIAL